MKVVLSKHACQRVRERLSEIWNRDARGANEAFSIVTWARNHVQRWVDRFAPVLKRGGTQTVRIDGVKWVISCYPDGTCVVVTAMEAKKPYQNLR